MAAPKKDRSKEIQVIFDNLKFCSYDVLRTLSEKVTVLMMKKQSEAIEKKKEELQKLQRQIEIMEKELESFVVVEEEKE